MSLLSFASIDATPVEGWLPRFVGFLLLGGLLLTFAASVFVALQAATFSPMT